MFFRSVFDGGILKLGAKGSGSRIHKSSRRSSVGEQTELAGPHCRIRNTYVGVEDHSTLSTHHEQLFGKLRNIRLVVEGGIKGTKGDHIAVMLKFGPWECIPGESDTIGVLP